jgi:hypothetical protein
MQCVVPLQPVVAREVNELIQHPALARDVWDATRLASVVEMVAVLVLLYC